MQKNIFVLLIFIFCVINYSFAKNPNLLETKERDLKVIIEFVKNSKKYYKNEPLKINLILNNQNESDIVINKRLVPNFDIIFSIKKPSGEYVTFSHLVFVGPPQQDDFIKLAKKSEVKFIFDLIEYNLNEIGKYSVMGIYQNQYDGSEFGLKAWTGRIESNVLEFEIR